MAIPATPPGGISSATSTPVDSSKKDDSTAITIKGSIITLDRAATLLGVDPAITDKEEQKAAILEKLESARERFDGAKKDWKVSVIGDGTGTGTGTGVNDYRQFMKELRLDAPLPEVELDFTKKPEELKEKIGGNFPSWESLSEDEKTKRGTKEKYEEMRAAYIEWCLMLYAIGATDAQNAKANKQKVGTRVSYLMTVGELRNSAEKHGGIANAAFKQKIATTNLTELEPKDYNDFIQSLGTQLDEDLFVKIDNEGGKFFTMLHCNEGIIDRVVQESGEKNGLVWHDLDSKMRKVATTKCLQAWKRVYFSEKGKKSEEDPLSECLEGVPCGDWRAWYSKVQSKGEKLAEQHGKIWHLRHPMQSWRQQQHRLTARFVREVVGENPERLHGFFSQLTPKQQEEASKYLTSKQKEVFYGGPLKEIKEEVKKLEKEVTEPSVEEKIEDAQKEVEKSEKTAGEGAKKLRAATPADPAVLKTAVDKYIDLRTKLREQKTKLIKADKDLQEALKELHQARVDNVDLKDPQAKVDKAKKDIAAAKKERDNLKSQIGKQKEEVNTQLVAAKDPQQAVKDSMDEFEKSTTSFDKAVTAYQAAIREDDDTVKKATLAEKKAELEERRDEALRVLGASDDPTELVKHAEDFTGLEPLDKCTGIVLSGYSHGQKSINFDKTPMWPSSKTPDLLPKDGSDWSKLFKKVVQLSRGAEIPDVARYVLKQLGGKPKDITNLIGSLDEKQKKELIIACAVNDDHVPGFGELYEKSSGLVSEKLVTDVAAEKAKAGPPPGSVAPGHRVAAIEYFLKQFGSESDEAKKFAKALTKEQKAEFIVDSMKKGKSLPCVDGFFDAVPPGSLESLVKEVFKQSKSSSKVEAAEYLLEQLVGHGDSAKEEERAKEIVKWLPADELKNELEQRAGIAGSSIERDLLYRFATQDVQKKIRKIADDKEKEDLGIASGPTL